MVYTHRDDASLGRRWFMSEKQIGSITHWFGKIKVIVIDISKGKLEIGDKIRVKGQTTDFTKTIKSCNSMVRAWRRPRRGRASG